MKTIDFTSNMWGHSFHGHTFGRITKYGSWLSRKYDEWKNIRRYTAMVHSCVWPDIGDRIIYKSERGNITATIFEIKHCWDPRDMHTLFFKVEDKPIINPHPKNASRNLERNEG